MALERTLLDLPEELWHTQIFPNVSDDDWLNVSSTCKQLRLFGADIFWGSTKPRLVRGQLAYLRWFVGLGPEQQPVISLNSLFSVLNRAEKNRELYALALTAIIQVSLKKHLPVAHHLRNLWLMTLNDNSIFFLLLEKINLHLNTSLPGEFRLSWYDAVSHDMYVSWLSEQDLITARWRLSIELRNATLQGGALHQQSMAVLTKITPKLSLEQAMLLIGDILKIVIPPLEDKEVECEGIVMTIFPSDQECHDQNRCFYYIACILGNLSFPVPEELSQWWIGVLGERVKIHAKNMHLDASSVDLLYELAEQTLPVIRTNILNLFPRPYDLVAYIYAWRSNAAIGKVLSNILVSSFSFVNDHNRIKIIEDCAKYMGGDYQELFFTLILEILIKNAAFAKQILSVTARVMDTPKHRLANLFTAHSHFTAELADIVPFVVGHHPWVRILALKACNLKIPSLSHSECKTLLPYILRCLKSKHPNIKYTAMVSLELMLQKQFNKNLAIQILLQLFQTGREDSKIQILTIFIRVVSELTAKEKQYLYQSLHPFLLSCDWYAIATPTFRFPFLSKVLILQLLPKLSLSEEEALSLLPHVIAAASSKQLNIQSAGCRTVGKLFSTLSGENWLENFEQFFSQFSEELKVRIVQNIQADQLPLLTTKLMNMLLDTSQNIQFRQAVLNKLMMHCRFLKQEHVELLIQSIIEKFLSVNEFWPTLLSQLNNLWPVCTQEQARVVFDWIKQNKESFSGENLLLLPAALRACPFGEEVCALFPQHFNVVSETMATLEKYDSDLRLEALRVGEEGSPLVTPACNISIANHAATTFRQPANVSVSAAPPAANTTCSNSL